MKQIVIIACAGWKGAGRGTPYVHLPAPFLPLPDGTTAASRLAAQFKAMDYEVALTVGPLGYRFRECQPRHEFRWSPMYVGKTSAEIAEIIGVDPEGTPWTVELYNYAMELGQLIVQPDPGWKTKHDSYCVAIDALPGYDRVVLARGDKLYETWFLEKMLETTPWSAQFALEVYHSFFLLDRKGLKVYRADAQYHRMRSTAQKNWGDEMAKQPDGGEGTGRLARAGIPHYGFHDSIWSDTTWPDISADMDHPHGYALSRQRVEHGEFL